MVDYINTITKSTKSNIKKLLSNNLSRQTINRYQSARIAKFFNAIIAVFELNIPVPPVRLQQLRKLRSVIALWFRPRFTLDFKL